ENYVALARLGHVSTARITQILNLCNLAPDLQEELLHLPPGGAGAGPGQAGGLAADRGAAGLAEAAGGVASAEAVHKTPICRNRRRRPLFADVDLYLNALVATTGRECNRVLAEGTTPGFELWRQNEHPTFHSYCLGCCRRSARRLRPVVHENA